MERLIECNYSPTIYVYKVIIISKALLNALLYFPLSVWWLFIFVGVNIKEKLSRSNLNILLITFQNKKGRTLSLHAICYNYSEWDVAGAVRLWLRLTDGWHQLHALIVCTPHDHSPFGDTHFPVHRAVKHLTNEWGGMLPAPRFSSYLLSTQSPFTQPHTALWMWAPGPVWPSIWRGTGVYFGGLWKPVSDKVRRLWTLNSS